MFHDPDNEHGAAKTSSLPRFLWHATSATKTLALVEGSQGGLATSEASSRLERTGRNELPRPKQPGLVFLFLRQFASPLIYLLLAAAAVSLLAGEYSDAGFIAAVLILNATIGTFQEGRARTSMEALSKLIRHSARVRRDGALATIDAAELVVGDLVELESGMAVPADLRLLTSLGLLANESSLTGESLPVRKEADAAVDAGAGLAERSTMLHAGTTIAEGRGTGVVVATGLRTTLGTIQFSLRTSLATEAPLVHRLHRLARQIAVAAVLLIVLLAALLSLRGEPAQHILLLSVALAVSAVPEGLPIAVTVALATATRRMARRNVIIRSLPAVEGLGACTLIASDKTGTLTLNRLTVEEVALRAGLVLHRSDWSPATPPTALLDLAYASALCNDAVHLGDGTYEGDAVDASLLAFAAEATVDPNEINAALRLNALPYEPVRKFASVIVRSGETVQLIAKGAPETVLPMCTDVDPADADRAQEMAANGYRVLAVAASRIDSLEAASCVQPCGLRLLGFVGLLDPLRPEVPEAVARCAEAGISVRIITGDHPRTALTIARQLGIASAMNEVVTGPELARLDERPDEQTETVKRARVFARIEPSQKLKIVQILAASGEIVAVTGDGINDAPALQAAHIGVAMGKGGTDVARGASDLVLADDNFASIVAGVEEGRITYGNIRKIIIFVLATGSAEIFMFLGSIAVGLPMPLTPVQLIWANLVTNGAQDVMLGFGKGEGDELRVPPRAASAPLVDRTVLLLILPPAIVMTGIALWLMSWSLDRGQTVEEARNLVLLLVVLFQNVYVLCLRSERRALVAEGLGSNPWLLLGVSGALALHVLAMHWPPLSALLGLNPPGWYGVLLCVAAALLLVAVTEVTKRTALDSARRAQ